MASGRWGPGLGGQADPIPGGHSAPSPGASCPPWPSTHSLSSSCLSDEMAGVCGPWSPRVCLLSSVMFGTFLLALIRSNVAAGGHPGECAGLAWEKDRRWPWVSKLVHRGALVMVSVSVTSCRSLTHTSLAECRNGVTRPPIRGIYKLLFNKWPLWQVLQG